MTLKALAVNDPPSQLAVQLANGQSILATPTAIGAGGGLTTSFVWRPGVTPTAPNTFETWAALYAAKAALPVGTACVVTLDGTSGNCDVTAGTFDFTGFTFVDPTDNFTAIRFADGAHIVPNGGFAVVDCQLGPTLGASIPLAVGNGDAYLIHASGAVLQAGSAAFLQTTGTGAAAILGDFVGVFSGAAPFFDSQGGTSGAVGVNFYGNSTIEAGAIAGPGPMFVNVSSDVALPATIPGTWAVTLTSDAKRVTFEPATPGNWGTPTPAKVSDALDQLAAPNTGNGLQGPASAATVSITMGALTQKKNGQFLVSGTISGQTTVPAVVTFTLLQDGGAIPSSPAPTMNVQGSDTWIASISWIAVPGDGLPHNFGIQATTSAGVIVLAADQGGIVATEL